MTTVETIKGAVPVLVTVTHLCEGFKPSRTEPKLRLLALTLAPGVSTIPLPERLTVCGLPVASLVTMTLPDSEPSVVGVKVTWIVQVAPTAKLAGLTGQLLLCAKSPVMAIPLIVTAILPLLVSVTACGALVVPCCWFPKLRLDVETVIARIGEGGAVTVSEAVLVTPPATAEMETALVVATAFVWTVKVAVVLPEGTVTLGGTVAVAVLLLERLTTTPPAGAAPLSVTVPLDVPPPRRLVGLSATDVGVGGAGTWHAASAVLAASDAWLTPFTLTM